MPWLEQHAVAALLRLAAFLRRALALRSAGAVQVALRRSARTPARSRTSTRRSAACCNGSTRSGLTERTIVVAIGDHGESLGEHGEGTHGLFIYEATMRVPFIVRAPFAACTAAACRGAVRSEDVMPTVLDLVGRAAPAGHRRARSLVPLLTGAATDLNLDAYSESLYARNHYGWSELRAIRAGRFKYIAATRPELYDLERDPASTKNLVRRTPLARRAHGAASSSGSGVESRQRRRDHRRSIPKRVSGSPRWATSDRSPTRRAKPGEALPDPKDKIDIFNLMMSAHETRRRGRRSDARSRG